MRAEAKQLLLRCDPALGQALGVRLQQSGLIPPGAAVAGFWPLGQEINLVPLLQALRYAGHVVALPHTPPSGHPLAFRRWDEADALARERFGTMTATGPEVEPDMLLVPMLAFDRRR